MTDQTESDGLDHTRDGVPEGRLAGEVERLTGLYNQRMVHLHSAQDREVALLDEVARLTSELAAAREELAQRREHMRRGIEAGRSTGGEG